MNWILNMYIQSSACAIENIYIFSWTFILFNANIDQRRVSRGSPGCPPGPLWDSPIHQKNTLINSNMTPVYQNILRYSRKSFLKSVTLLQNIQVFSTYSSLYSSSNYPVNSKTFMVGNTSVDDFFSTNFLPFFELV